LVELFLLPSAMRDDFADPSGFEVLDFRGIA